MSGSTLRTADCLDIREDKPIGVKDSFGSTFLTHEIGIYPASGIDFLRSGQPWYSKPMAHNCDSFFQLFNIIFIRGF